MHHVKGGNHVINFDAHDIQQRIKLAERRKDVQETKEHKKIYRTVCTSELSRERNACTCNTRCLYCARVNTGGNRIIQFTHSENGARTFSTLRPIPSHAPLGVS
jgi:hypothetical protein